MPVPPYLLAAIRQPAFAYRADGAVAGANDLAVALAGRPLDGMTPAGIVNWFRIRGRDGVGIFPHELPAARAVRGEEVVDAPLTITAADGRAVQILATASPLPEGGCLTVWQDVTALVEAEERERRQREEVQAQNEELQTQQEELRVQEEELRCQADELRESEEALRESEARFRSMVESISDSFMALDRDWRFTYINRRATGYGVRTPADVIGRTLWEAFPAIVGTPLETFYREAMERREPMTFENRSAVATGRTFELHAYPWGTGLSIFGQDITARKRAEAALAESERRYRELVESANSAIIRWNRDGAVTFANEYAEALFGYDRGGIVGLMVKDLVPAQESTGADLSALIAEILAAPEERTVNVNENIRRDGSRFWMVWTNRATYDERGGVAEILAVGTEITAQREAAKELRESEARLVEAQRLAKVGDWEWDLATDEVVWSRETNAIFGRNPDLDAPSFREEQSRYYTPQSWERLSEAVQGAIEADEPYDLEIEVIREDGEHRWLVARGEAVRDAGGAVAKLRGTVQDVTERKEAEEALRETRDYLDSLIDYANAPIIVWDPAFRITRFNHAFEHLSGYTADEVIGRDLVMLFPAENREESLRKIRQTITEQWESVEIPILRPDGTVRIALWNSANIYDSEGTGLLATIAQGQDITERTRAEEAVRESAARQELLADVASRLLESEEPQAVIDELGRRALGVLDCDAFFNYTADKGSGRLVLNAYGGIPAEEAERIRYLDYGAAVCGCVARDGCRIVAEAIPAHPDPKTALVAGYGVRAYACHPLVVDGRTIGTLSFGTKSRDTFDADDLATMQAIADLIAVAMQRIADREALRESEQRLREVLEVSLDAVYRRDLVADRYDYLSPVIREITGYSEGEFAALSLDDVMAMIHPDDRSDALAAIEAGAADGAGTVEYRLRHRDGTWRWIQDYFAVRCDDAGRPLLRGGVIRDVTQRKEAELALITYTDRLRYSNEELQRFAYVASHDLQEPLRSIVSFSQLLERRYRGQLGQDADEFIGFIVEGGVRMQRLIRDLLQVSRLETAAKPLEPTDAGAVLRDALVLLNGQIQDLGGSVTVGPLPRVMADAAQLEQVFVNLIGNAIKYRREGVPPAIRVTARVSNPTVEFAVVDNGIGIEEQYFDRIFEMFRRLHTHDAYEGTGIGLAVVKRIVERHGGRVRVESTPGEGSTFFFTLPAA